MSTFQTTNETLLFLCDFLANELTENLQITPNQAEKIAKNTVSNLAKNFGGSLLYIPKNTLGDLAQRNQSIVNEFDGTNQAELARKHGISLQQCYKIIKESRKK